MDDLKIGYHPLGEKYGYYIDKAPQIVLNELKVQIDELQNNFSKGKKYNDYLAGEIEHEYAFPYQPQTFQYIKDLSHKFEVASGYGDGILQMIPTLSIDTLWINFQKKCEYNPLHSHSGLYSFVIWYQIPYSIESEEKHNYKSKEKSFLNGRFSFYYPSVLNFRELISNRSLDIDKSKEGYVAMFPSNLCHAVYPFYSSDDYRITISGNIDLS
jgi:hypothetical protein